MPRKQVSRVLPTPAPHWVGDGFPVSSVISPQWADRSVSPFLMLDYGGPHHFDPATRPRGVDEHPHRGFETVTLVFDGELEHRDSAGNSGAIGPGDVQWMTAASGVLHEEKHSRAFTSRGGPFEVAQFWVNLPASAKMTSPRYQTLVADQIPTFEQGGVRIRAIAGSFRLADRTITGAARTVTPLFLWDMELAAGAELELPVADGHTLAVFVRDGSLNLDGTSVPRRSLALFSHAGAGTHIKATEHSRILAFGGEPIDEPVVSYGPFVMNSTEEIHQAIADYRAGRFGVLSPAT